MDLQQCSCLRLARVTTYGSDPLYSLYRNSPEWLPMLCSGPHAPTPSAGFFLSPDLTGQWAVRGMPSSEGVCPSQRGPPSCFQSHGVHESMGPQNEEGVGTSSRSTLVNQTLSTFMCIVSRLDTCLYVHMCAHHVCIWCSQRPQVTRASDTPAVRHHVVLGSNLGPLQEQ